MTALRNTTLEKIEEELDRSYFTAASFTVVNKPDNEPFLVIKFIPMEAFSFEVSDIVHENDEFRVDAAPGEHIASGESYYCETFAGVISEITKWTGRIREDLKAARKPEDEIEEFVQRLRAELLKDDGGKEEYSSDQIDDLKDRLTSLQEYVEVQAKKLEVTEHQIWKFKNEIESIKSDLGVMPRSVWRTVAGNKIIKSVTTFFKTSEGRKLIADSLRKLIE